MSDQTGGEDGYTPLMGASRNFVDVNTLARHENPNYEGTPTQFFDDQGNLKAILADLVGSGQHPIDPYSFNPILKEGEKLSADTARQATNEENQLLFLDNEGNQTTRPTDTPMVGGTLRDVMYEKDPGSRGGILPKDFYQGAALMAAAATAGVLGPAFLAGEGATAFPVAGGALLPGTELGAPALGVAGGDIGAFTAADMAATAASEGALSAGSLTAGITPEMVAGWEAALPETMADIGGLATPAALTPEAATSLLEGLTDEQATNLMEYGLLPEELQVPAVGTGLAGLTGAEALKYANLAKGILGAATGIAGAGGGGGGGTPGAGGNYGSYGTGGGGALPGNLTSTSLPGSSTAMLDPFKDYDKYQQLQAIQNQQAIQHVPVAEPLYAASGGDVTSLAQIQERLSQLDPRLNSVLQNKLKANYYTYGSDNTGGLPTQLMGGQLGSKPSPGYPSQAASNARTPLYDTYGYKPASLTPQERAPETVYAKDGGHIPEFITGATGHYVKGRGDGQSDEIPAMLADGEYVFDAETVAQLGNGSSDAGAKVLDQMRENIREHKRSAPIDKIPPKSKSPLEYMAESKRK